ncbi:unnamed protein product, partial [Rotaria socialis]
SPSLPNKSLNSFSTVSLGDARLVLGNISLKLKTIIQDKSNINDYSTWFSSTFQQQNRILDKSSIRELEIPGQHPRKLYQDYVTTTYQTAKPAAKTA